MEHTLENGLRCEPCPIKTLCDVEEKHHEALRSVFSPDGEEMERQLSRIAGLRTLLADPSYPASLKERDRPELARLEAVLAERQAHVDSDYVPPYDLAELRNNCPEGSPTIQEHHGTMMRYCASQAIDEATRENTALPVTD